MIRLDAEKSASASAFWCLAEYLFIKNRLSSKGGYDYSIVIYTFVWLTGLGGFYDKAFVNRITESFGLGPIPAWASITLYFLFTATFTVIRDFATEIGEELAGADFWSQS